MNDEPRWLRFELKEEVYRMMNRQQYKAVRRYLRVCARKVEAGLQAVDVQNNLIDIMTKGVMIV